MKLSPPRVDAAQRETLRLRRERLLDPAFAAAILRRHLGESQDGLACELQDESPDRFVVRVEARTAGGARALYAFKSYADARGERLWAIAQALHAHARGADAVEGAECPICLPIAYVPEHGLMVYPWVHGSALRDAIRASDAARLSDAAAHAAATLAWAHRARIPAEAPRKPLASLERAYHRCARFVRWPDANAVVRPVLAALEDALTSLEESPMTFVHGDPGPANLLFDGRRWVLIDLDRCGFGDPAYDVGYLLAQLTRRCLEQPGLAALVPQVAATLESAYRAQMPQVPARNIRFYYAATLAQKLIMTWREHPADPLAAMRPLAQRALSSACEALAG
jgi:aminoglycoside phosphotransferase (APT) family kinase protein